MRIKGVLTMIFLDTGYFKGLYDKKDPHHDDALSIKDYINTYNELTVINTTVLVETLNRSVLTNMSTREIYNDLYYENQVIELTNEDYLESLRVNEFFGNSINYSDCTIINTMIKNGIRKIVTFDSDFMKVRGWNVIYSM